MSLMHILNRKLCIPVKDFAGFTLLEVMIALCVIMFCVLSITRLSILAYQTESYSEGQTYASILCSSRLASLRNLPADAPDLGVSWHQDSTNPIRNGNREYYRFWLVSPVTNGLEITVYAAWDDKTMGAARNFSSQEDLSAGKCPRVKMGGFLQAVN